MMDDEWINQRWCKVLDNPAWQCGQDWDTLAAPSHNAAKHSVLSGYLSCRTRVEAPQKCREVPFCWGGAWGQLECFRRSGWKGEPLGQALGLRELMFRFLGVFQICSGEGSCVQTRAQTVWGPSAVFVRCSSNRLSKHCNMGWEVVSSAPVEDSEQVWKQSVAIRAMVLLPWVNTMTILTLEEAAWSPGVGFHQVNLIKDNSISHHQPIWNSYTYLDHTFDPDPNDPSVWWEVYLPVRYRIGKLASETEALRGWVDQPRQESGGQGRGEVQVLGACSSSS